MRVAGMIALHALALLSGIGFAIATVTECIGFFDHDPDPILSGGEG